jgi:hypothetical protein
VNLNILCRIVADCVLSAGCTDEKFNFTPYPPRIESELFIKWRVELLTVLFISFIDPPLRPHQKNVRVIFL